MTTATDIMALHDKTMEWLQGSHAEVPEDYANEVSAAIRAYLATSRSLAPLPAPMPGDMAETIALIRKRMKSGECDLRDVGQILTGRFDQDVPAAILAAAAAVEDLSARLEAAERANSTRPEERK
ncbi:MAG: hypothetical protein E5X86_19655 [Mesorhizobium sp.]|uniref:hypothetical protein n=1 Tax=Mesorhizobium sp. TaxID=1871066 RepID=UPI001206EDEA|nr:hypothetical protein [Mesorhizobium sp.]TIO15589.1 MAG: hypothetical protein E5X86_19655 [Mesorhizobium sp.]